MAGDAERVLTKRELNRALLARQMLLERSRARVPAVLGRMGGLQAQYAPSMYIGLWTRMAEFERGALDRALNRRSVVQGTLMRSTIHLVSARDYWPLALAIREARRESWLRSHKGETAKRMAAVARRARRGLAKGPLRRSELDELLGKPGPVVLGGVGIWLDMVRVPPSGTWAQRRADLYAAAEDWIGEPDTTPKEGSAHLVRSYLRGFGPAPRGDIADFTGLPLTRVDAVLQGLKVRRFRDEQGNELLDLPRMPLPHPETPAPPRFLPVWDATLLVHARRTGILPERHRAKVFNVRTPQSVNTFLVDGEVAGTWLYEKGRVRLQPFGKLSRTARGELETEAERLAALHR